MGGMLGGPVCQVLLPSGNFSCSKTSKSTSRINLCTLMSKFDAEVWFAGANSGKASSQVATNETGPSPCLLSLDAHSLKPFYFNLPRSSHPSPTGSAQVEEPNMKLPLGITLALLLILQTFQQVTTQIPDDWKRSDETTDNNGEQTFSEEITAQPSKEHIQSNEDAQAKPESSSENEGQPFGSIYYSQGGEENSTKLNQSPEQSAEEASSDGPVATTLPPMIALNSSSELSDTSAESNETLTQDTTTNTTPEPEHTDESALNDTYTTPQPETTTTESSHDESGSGYLPSDDVPTNSTTKSPTTTTKDESIQSQTTVSPTEPPVYRTTTAAIPPAFPEDVTTPGPEDTEINQTEPIDTGENSERGLSSDVSDGTESKKGQAWTIVLVIGIVVGVLALGAFIFLNRRNRKDFSHRKLVEEMSPDPVLRLDNSEPLDLKFDGLGYYNPGLQGDNIQMTNFPQGRSK